jgi:hypothetical protein
VREQKMNDAWLSYYSQGIALLKKSNTGAAFLDALPALKDSLGLDRSDSGLESVFNAIAQKNHIATSRFYDQARFLASVSVPVRKPYLSLTVIAGLIMGFMIGAGYALWISRERQVKTDANIPLNNLMLQRG